MIWTDIAAPVRAALERDLTSRELEVFRLSLGGMGDRTIANALGVHRTTVQDARRRARIKAARIIDPKGRHADHP